MLIDKINKNRKTNLRKICTIEQIPSLKFEHNNFIPTII